MDAVKIATWSEVPDRTPIGATVEGIDLVIVRQGDEHSVLYGRCLHRGALLADGTVQGDDLICGVHGWDYRIETGVSAYNNAEALEKFTSVLEGDDLFVDRNEVAALHDAPPAAVRPRRVPGLLPGPAHGPGGAVRDVHPRARGATGSPRPAITVRSARWACRATSCRSGTTSSSSPRSWRGLPQLDAEPVGTEVCIGPNADKPLWLDIPLFVSDMSFGALSRGGEDGAVPGRRARRHRHLLG